MSRPGLLDLLAVVMAPLGLVLVGLSTWELHKPDRSARAAGLAWLLAAAGWGLLAVFLHEMAATSHLPHGQRPFARLLGLSGAGFALLTAGTVTLAWVGTARERAVGGATGPHEAGPEGAGGSESDVWPPSPRIP